MLRRGGVRLQAVTVMVALLRGVNVGGRAKLAMADLRTIATDLGYGDVATYIQSGNLVFTATGTSGAVAEKLARAIGESTEVHPAVLVRTRAQLAKVVAGNPFLARGADPAHLHVTFTDGPVAAALTELDVESFAPEEAKAVGHELYLHLPNGMGRSRLGATLARRESGGGTTRNWRTVTTLLEMAQQAG